MSGISCQNPRMKRIALVFVIATSFLCGSISFAAVKSGSACTKQGATSIYSGKKYTCIKSGKKLVWDKGVIVKNAITDTPGLPKTEPTSKPSSNSNNTIPRIDSLQPTLEQPVYYSHLISKKDFTIQFRVENNATSGFLEIKELGLNYENTLKQKESRGIVTIQGEIPASFSGSSIKVFFYAASATAKSPCCTSIDLMSGQTQTNGDKRKTQIYSGLDLFEFQQPTKINSKPKAQLTNSKEFSDLSACKLKDGDSKLDNMTIGFPIPAGRADQTKPVNVVVLAADFPNVQATSKPADDYKKSLETMEHFWEWQASNGLDIVVKVSQSYKRMPKNIEDYSLGATFQGFKGENYWEFIQAVIDLYDSEFDFTDVSTIAVAVPLRVTREQIGTWVVHTQGEFSTKEGKVFNVMITGNGDSKASTGAWVHEFGHTLGLTDMRYVNDANPEIQAPEGLGIYDVMGSGSAAAETLVWSRFLTNILLPTQIHCITSTKESTHWLIPIEQQLSELKGVIIPLSEFTAIVVESRRNYGFDSIGTEAEGAIVYTIDSRIPYHRSPAHIVSPSRSKDLEWYTDSALKLNESVTTNGWKITVVESGDFGDVVKVEKVG